MTKRIGNQFPTRSFVLPYTNSVGEEAIDVYEKSGRTAQEWQFNLIQNIMATNDDELWTHTKYGYSVSRRNGKSEIVLIRAMWGLVNGERILFTAHRTTTSHSAWEKLVSFLNDAGFVEGDDYKKIAQFGLERIEMLTEDGGVISFRTRTTTGGLGEGFDLLIIDEAQEYTTDQESALKYVVTDSENPQTIFCGTPPTPLSSGTVFMDYRNNTLNGDNFNSGWAEWSVESESDPKDKELWYKTNPSLGTIFTERSVADEIGPDVIDFNIQRLGLWIKYNQKSAITEVDWADLKVSKLPALTGPLFVGIKYGHDGLNVAMSIAVKTKSGLVFVEAIDCQSMRNGNQWIINFLKTAEIGAVVVDGANGQSILEREMKDFSLPKPILPTVKEVIKAHALFEQAIYGGTVCHKDQPSLTIVATNCEKRNIGSNGGFGYRSQIEEHDIALLDSIVLAHWACAEAKSKVKQRVYT